MSTATQQPPRHQMVFTRNKLVAFKAAYGEAVGASQAAFTFEGHEFDTSYARYLIQHLETSFKRGGL